VGKKKAVDSDGDHAASIILFVMWDIDEFGKEKTGVKEPNYFS
jgi:hypothetical protein